MTLCVLLQDWLANVISKQAAFHSLAEFYQSLVCREAKEFGEEIVRLRVSVKNRRCAHAT